MYKKVLSVFLILALAVTMIPMPLGEAYAEDINENDEPSGFIMPVEQKTEVPEGYIGIYTKTDLNNIRNDLKANYILMNDIDLIDENGKAFSWFIIEDEFRGTFDGNGHKIKGLNIDSYYDNIGLFAKVSGRVINLIMEDVNFTILSSGRTVPPCVGAIAGKLSYNGVIDNCGIIGTLTVKNPVYKNKNIKFGGIAGLVYNSGKVSNCFNNSTTDLSADIPTKGGIVGVSNASITNCTNYSSIKNGDVSGGIVGKVCDNDNIIIENCHNEGDIEGQRYAAGIVGVAEKDVTICNSYNKGNVVSEYSSAGIVSMASNSSSINNCYNSGKIDLKGSFAMINENDFFAGGIIGKANQILNIENCYNIGDITQRKTRLSSGNLGGIAGIIIAGEDFTTNISNCYNQGNINVEGLSATSFGGGIVGYSYYNAVINNSHNLGNVHVTTKPIVENIVGIAYAGGISGYSSCEISNCYNKGDITAESTSDNSYSGGISGHTKRNISFCYNVGNIEAISLDGSVAGGISGELKDQTIAKCYNGGNVYAYGKVRAESSGGIVGEGGIDSIIEDCFNSGSISGMATVAFSQTYIGGILGGDFSYLGSVYRCYNVGDVSVVGTDIKYLGGITGQARHLEDCFNLEGIGKIKYKGTTELSSEMMIDSSFFKNFDFVNVWSIDKTGYRMPYIKGLTKPAGDLKKSYASIEPEKIYTGKALFPKIVLNDRGTVLVENVHYKVDYTNNKNVGIGTANIIGIGEYKGGFELQFQIHPQEINKCKVVLSHNAYSYDGKTKTPSVTVYNSSGEKLILDKDYRLYYSKGRQKIGSYFVNVEMMGNYTGDTELDFTIGPKDTSGAKAKLTGHDDVKISWKKVKGAKGYNVYYKKAGASSYEKLTTTTGNPINGDTYYCRKLNLADGTKYYFKVCAYKKVDGIECQNNGKTLSVTTLKKVKSVKAKKSGSKVKISWSNIAGESGYQISKSTSKSKTGTITTYKTTKGKSKTISATKGKTYYYKVRAYKTVGDKKIYGPWSSVVKYKR